MKYVLAISGGIDSVVLLDKTATDIEFRKLHFGGAFWPKDFVVAHFDHGIRDDSNEDLKFVRSLATNYHVQFESEKADLRKDSSEESARDKRYAFLFSLAKGFDKARVVTAHHQDDLIETIVINLLRGTGWRGLSPMSGNISRPFISMSKVDIVSYAINHNLEWREDSTNFSNHYFRNRVRHFLAYQPIEFRNNLIRLYDSQRNLRTKIEIETRQQLMGIAESTRLGMRLPRYFMIMLPVNVAIEILNLATDGRLTNPQLSQIVLFTKVGKPGKRMNFDHLGIYVTKRELFIETT